MNKHSKIIAVCVLSIAVCGVNSNAQVRKDFLSSSAGVAYLKSIDTSTKEGVEKLVRLMAVRYELLPNMYSALIKTESSFNPHAISVKGCVGLAQVCPQTWAKELGFERWSDLKVPYNNLMAGAIILRQYLDESGGDYSIALQKYNGGPGCVNRCSESKNHAIKTLAEYAMRELKERA